MLLAALAISCGGDETVAVSVQMALDPGTCPRDEPDAIRLDCAAAAGVWLRAGSGDDYLDHACLDFTGEGQTLAALPQLLAGIDLASEDDRTVSVDVAVYAPWQSLDGCPAPGDLSGGDVPGGPEMVVWGSSGPVQLSQSGGALQVLLQCGSIGEGNDAGECEQRCDSDQAACLDDTEVAACGNAFDECLDSCTGDGCEESCEGEYQSCLAGTPTGGCALSFDECLFGCGGDEKCAGACDGDYVDCLEQTCRAIHDSCVGECAAGPQECVSVAEGF
jgi:hypothetical protein